LLLFKFRVFLLNFFKEIGSKLVVDRLFSIFIDIFLNIFLHFVFALFAYIYSFLHENYAGHCLSSLNFIMVKPLFFVIDMGLLLSSIWMIWKHAYLKICMWASLQWMNCCIIIVNDRLIIIVRQLIQALKISNYLHRFKEKFSNPAS
jgi:hypothetical protein